MNSSEAHETEPQGVLPGLYEMITPERDTGNSFYISGRKFASGDVELIALKLSSEDQLKNGGGGKRKNTDKSTMDELTIQKSINRARTMVRRKLMTMCADRMLTLTFKENVTDMDEAWNCFKYFTKLMRQRYGKQFVYVAVPEYQKRGAVHFHLAVSGFYHANTVRRIWHRAVGHRGGNIDITSPRVADKNSWNPRRIANYLSKYLTKEETVVFNRRRYSSGGDIQIPAPETGWLSYGLPVPHVLKTVAQKWADRNVVYVTQFEAYFEVTYVST